MTKVAVLQSSYIPWKGYFDIIHDVDHFIFYDDVSYTKNDWRNRNKIKTEAGAAWITIPAGNNKGKLIHEVRLENTAWQAKHWRTISQTYAKAPYFDTYKQGLEEIYLETDWASLSDLNQHVTRLIAREWLGIRTEFSDSRTFALQGQKQDRLLDLLKQAGARTYVSGPAAQAYIDPADFQEAGIELIWKDYTGYPEYPQAHPPFEHGVSVLDLLFQTGPDAADYIWGWRS